MHGYTKSSLSTVTQMYLINAVFRKGGSVPFLTDDLLNVVLYAW